MSDLASHELMIAGRGCPTSGCSAPTSMILNGSVADAAGFGFDYSNWVKLPANVGATGSLTRVSFVWTGGANKLASVRVGVLRPSAGTDEAPTALDLVSVSACTGTLTGNNQEITVTLDTPLTVEQFDRIAVECTSQAGEYATVGATLDTVADTLNYSRAAALGTPGSTTYSVAGDLTSRAATHPMLFRGYVATTAKRFDVTVGALGVGTVQVESPSFRGTPYWLIFEGVQASVALTINLLSIQTATGANSTKLVAANTIIYDPVAKTITWTIANGTPTAVALDAGESNADTFNFYVWVDAANKQWQLYWQNVTTGQGLAGGTQPAETAMRCHPVARTGVRRTVDVVKTSDNNIQHISQVSFVVAAETASITAFAAARRPWFVAGASWPANATPPIVRSSLGTELHDSAQSGFVVQPYIINTSNGGDRLMYNGPPPAKVSWWKRFGLAAADDESAGSGPTTASTIGLHDLCEVRDATVFLLFCMAYNDMAALTETAYIAAQVERAVRILGRLIAWLHGDPLAGAVNRSNTEVVLTDVPPVTSAGTGANYVRGCIARKRFNQALPGIANATQCVYVPINRLLGGQGQEIETLSAAYENPDNLGHLTTAGYRVVAKLLSAAYERGGDGGGDVPAEIAWPQGVHRDA